MSQQRRIPTPLGSIPTARKENTQPSSSRASVIRPPSVSSKLNSGSNSDLSSIRSVNTTLDGIDQQQQQQTSFMNRSSSSSLSSANKSQTTTTTMTNSSNSRINSTLTRANSGTSLNGSRNSSLTTGNNQQQAAAAPTSELVKNIEDIVARNKLLEEENSVLKNLIHQETNEERELDSRRGLMLKCQIYQLEKQINLLSKSLSFRKNSHVDAFNTISYLSDCFRSITQSNPVESKYYQIDKSEMMRWLDMTESVKLKLYKNMDNEQNGDDRNGSGLMGGEPSLLEHKYSIKPTTCDILDICSGNLNHINIKQVSLLESEMANLYKKLTRLRESLQTFQHLTSDSSSSDNDDSSRKQHQQQQQLLIHTLHTENLTSLLDESIKSTAHTCSNLFDLSLLIPSAPWAPIRKSKIDGVTQESLMLKLKSLGLPKAKQQPVESLLKSYFVASNYHDHMRGLESDALREELKFYRACAQTQKSYVQSVMSLLKSKYEQFVHELNESFNQPLRLLIDKFWLMKKESSEENLKEFLGLFKVCAARLETTLNSFDLLPRSDLVTATFHQLLRQLDSHVAKMNKECMGRVEEINIDRINLEHLSLQSDNLLLSELTNQQRD